MMTYFGIITRAARDDALALAETRSGCRQIGRVPRDGRIADLATANVGRCGKRFPLFYFPALEMCNVHFAFYA